MTEYVMNDELSAQIVTNMIDNTPPDIDTREGAPTFTALAPIADEFALLYAELKAQEEADFIVNEAGEITAYGIKLDNFVVAWGEKRKIGGQATGAVTLSAAEPTLVPAGTQVFAPATLNVVFSTNVDVTAIPTGVSVGVTAVLEGADGNVSARAITGIVGDLEGVITAANPTATSGGFDEESDDELASRFLNNRRNPAISGNPNHYKVWATEVAGVSDAYVIPAWNGPNTVKVILLSSERRAPTAAKVAEVKTYINSVRPVIGGTDPVAVEAATEVPINIAATVQISTTTTLAAVQTAYNTAVNLYLESLKFGVEDTVRLVRLQTALLDTEGVIDITTFTVNGAAANVVIPAGSVAVKGTVTIGV